MMPPPTEWKKAKRLAILGIDSRDGSGNEHIDNDILGDPHLSSPQTNTYLLMYSSFIYGDCLVGCKFRERSNN